LKTIDVPATLFVCDGRLFTVRPARAGTTNVGRRRPSNKNIGCARFATSNMGKRLRFRVLSGFLCAPETAEMAGYRGSRYMNKSTYHSIASPNVIGNFCIAQLTGTL
jgi:hypothetical protein